MVRATGLSVSSFDQMAVYQPFFGKCMPGLREVPKGRAMCGAANDRSCNAVLTSRGTA